MGYLGHFPNLKELEYSNPLYRGEVDLKRLTCVDSLEHLHLECGDSYIEFDAQRQELEYWEEKIEVTYR